MRYNVTIERNKVMDELTEIAEKINKLDSKEDVRNFLLEILTNSEVATLSKRWCILKMLYEGKTQREISKTLGVSLCKVTRGAKILKDKNTMITKMIKENKNDTKY